MRQLISWIQPTKDYRPLTYPPNEKILGWWKSGERVDGAAILVALIHSDSINEALDIVKSKWPEANEWVSYIITDCDWVPGGRFPLEDWM